MSNQGLHHSFLRPPILQILRAAGFHSTRPSVLETVVDLTARYLLLLASTTASYSTNNVHFPEPQLEDLCMAMQDCGVFRPQTTATEEEWLGEEDMRGVNAFLDWARGDVNKEIRRIAGRADRGEGAKDAIALDGQGGADDFITVLKKRHSKTGEESRYQGTVLGKSNEDRPVRIEGGPAESIGEWVESLSQRDSFSRLSSVESEPLSSAVVSEMDI